MIGLRIWHNGRVSIYRVNEVGEWSCKRSLSAQSHWIDPLNFILVSLLELRSCVVMTMMTMMAMMSFLSKSKVCRIAFWYIRTVLFLIWISNVIISPSRWIRNLVPEIPRRLLLLLWQERDTLRILVVGQSLLVILVVMVAVFPALLRQLHCPLISLGHICNEIFLVREARIARILPASFSWVVEVWVVNSLCPRLSETLESLIWMGYERTTWIFGAYSQLAILNFHCHRSLKQC